jgi:hypothetical protein
MKKFIPKSYVRWQLFKCPQPRIPFSWFMSSGVHKQPVLCEVFAPACLFYEEAMCKGSTGNGLLYAAKAVPPKEYFTNLTLTIARKGC